MIFLKNKKILFFASLLFIVLLFIPSISSSQGIFGFFNPFNWLGYIVNSILGVFYFFATQITDAALQFNLKILDKSNTIVTIGWKILRDVANLGFVIAIILIAFSTILRLENYAAKKLLTRLIAAAILVNFSLVIAGSIISFSHVFMNFFLGDKLSGGSSISLGTELTNAFGVQRLWLPEQDPAPPDPSEQGNFFSSLSTTVIVSLMNLAFGAIFMIIAIIVMLTLALMLLARYLVLSILLILSPLTWLFWVIPQLGSLNSKWWNTFISWTFFGPAATFFIYLALTSVSFLKNVPMQDTGGAGIQNILAQGAQMILISGMLIGGLIAAQKMGIAGAGVGMKALNTMGNKAKGWAGKAAARGTTKPLRSDWGKKATDKLQTVGQNSGFLVRNLTRPLREAGTGLSKARVSVEKQVKDEEKNISGLSLAEQAKRANTYSPPGKVVAMTNIMGERKKLTDQAEEHNKKVSGANGDLSSAEAELNQAEQLPDATTPNSDAYKKVAEAREKVEAARQRINDLTESQQKAVQNLQDFDEEILSKLPENMRQDIQNTSDISRTKLGRQYGKVGERYATKGKIAKIEDLLADIAKEDAKEGEKEKKGASPTT